MPRTLLGVGPAADSASDRLRGGAHLEVVDDEGEQQLLSDDTDQHETQLMLRDEMRAQIKAGRAAIPVAAVSAPEDHEGSTGAAARPRELAPRPAPDFQDPTPIASSGA